MVLLVYKLMSVAQSCSTLCHPTDCRPPGSSVCGFFQARIPEWIAISFSRGCSWPRDWTQVSSLAGRLFTICVTREAQWLFINFYINDTGLRIPCCYFFHSTSFFFFFWDHSLLLFVNITHDFQLLLRIPLCECITVVDCWLFPKYGFLLVQDTWKDYISQFPLQGGRVI